MRKFRYSFWTVSITLNHPDGVALSTICKSCQQTNAIWFPLKQSVNLKYKNQFRIKILKRKSISTRINLALYLVFNQRPFWNWICIWQNPINTFPIYLKLDLQFTGAEQMYMYYVYIKRHRLMLDEYKENQTTIAPFQTHNMTINIIQYAEAKLQK